MCVCLSVSLGESVKRKNYTTNFIGILRMSYVGTMVCHGQNILPKFTSYCPPPSLISFTI